MLNGGPLVDETHHECVSPRELREAEEGLASDPVS